MNGFWLREIGRVFVVHVNIFPLFGDKAGGRKVRAEVKCDGGYFERGSQGHRLLLPVSYSP